MYCRDAIANSDQASAPSSHVGGSPAGEPIGRWPSRWMTAISSPGTPQATSSGNSASTIRGRAPRSPAHGCRPRRSRRPQRGRRRRGSPAARAPSPTCRSGRRPPRRAPAQYRPLGLERGGFDARTARSNPFSGPTQASAVVPAGPPSSQPPARLRPMTPPRPPCRGPTAASALWRTFADAPGRFADAHVSKFTSARPFRWCAGPFAQAQRPGKFRAHAQSGDTSLPGSGGWCFLPAALAPSSAPGQHSELMNEDEHAMFWPPRRPPSLPCGRTGSW